MDQHKEDHPMEMDIEETEEKLRKYLEGRGSSRRMSFDPRDIHIMVVDDEKTSRIVVQKILKKCGYQGNYSDCIVIQLFVNSELNPHSNVTVAKLILIISIGQFILNYCLLR
jgi:hypothetical protein